MSETRNLICPNKGECPENGKHRCMSACRSEENPFLVKLSRQSKGHRQVRVGTYIWPQNREKVKDIRSCAQQQQQQQQQPQQQQQQLSHPLNLSIIKIMTTPPQNLQEVKRLLNTLYPHLSRNPVISKLHNTLLSRNSTPPPSSTTRSPILSTRPTPPIIDKLPLNKAISLLPPRTTPLTNILYFRTRNQQLQHQDFARLTSPLTSQFQYPSLKHRNDQFQVIQAREEGLLLPRGGYYLVFTDIRDAAAFMIDTLGFQMYGSNLYLEMVNYEEHKGFIGQTSLGEKEETLKEIDVEILKLRGVNRGRFAHVIGIPNYIKADTLKEMLWDYDLDYSDDGPVKCLKMDNVTKVGVWLIKFKNENDSERLRRNWNGKGFGGEQRLKKVFVSVLS